MRAVPTQWVFLAGCDMPTLSPRAVAWLSSHCPGDVDAVVLTADDHPQPLHSFYRRSSVSAAVEALAPGAGLRELLDALPECRTVSAAAAPDRVPVQRSIRNVNTRADLDAIEGSGSALARRPRDGHDGA